MFPSIPTATVLLTALLATPTPPQGENISKYPDTDALTGFQQTPAASLDEFVGRAVLLEFFDYDDNVCIGAIHNLNEMHARWSDKGLSIVGVTREDKGQTLAWVKEHKMQFPYAFDADGKLITELGVKQFPVVVLLDLSGRIVWQGVPSEVRDELVEQHLEGVISAPSWQWPDETGTVLKALQKRQYKKVLDAAAKLETPLAREIETALELSIAGRTAALEALYERGEYLDTVDTCRRMTKNFAGLEAGTVAKEMEKRITSDKEAKKQLQAQANVRKLEQTELHNLKQAEKTLKSAEKLARKYEGTVAGKKARLLSLRLMGKVKGFQPKKF